MHMLTIERGCEYSASDDWSTRLPLPPCPEHPLFDHADCISTYGQIYSALRRGMNRFRAGFERRSKARQPDAAAMELDLAGEMAVPGAAGQIWTW